MLAEADEVIVLNVTEVILGAIADWMSLRGRRFAPALRLHLLTGPGLALRPVGARWRFVETDPAFRARHRAAFRTISDVAGTVSLMVPSRLHQAELRAVSALPVDLFDFPLETRLRPESDHGSGHRELGPELEEGAQPPLAGAASRTILLYAGDAKAAKGLFGVPAILDRLAADFPDWTFLVHVHDVAGRYGALTQRLVDIASRHSNASLFLGWLEPQIYGAMIASSRAVVLTHTREAFHDMDSGLADHARAAGTQIFARSGTFFERRQRLEHGSTRIFATEDDLVDQLASYLHQQIPVPAQ